MVNNSLLEKPRPKLPIYIAKNHEDWDSLLSNCPKCGYFAHHDDYWLGDRECGDGVVRKCIIAFEMSCSYCGLIWMVK